MANEFRAMLDRFVLVYLDDILVCSRTLEDHLEHLRRVLETLHRAKYKANRDKCEFVRQELKYLGRFVTPEGISPLSDKIQVIQEWPEPRNVTDVRSFLGLVGYYQRFIKGYSKIATHLTKLQGEDRPFDFGEDAQESFLALKAALLSAEVLRIYNPLLFRPWVRCPMGICNAPTSFQRAMNMAFQNFVRKTRLAQSIINYCVIVYMDDILVYSSSYEGYVQHIEWALHALRDAGFKVALEKCQFFLTTISFLGHVPEAISAILAQVGPSGLESVVEYASKSVPACKRNYAAPAIECYAALWGISHFRAYLYGRKFTLVTDHEPLLILKKSKDYSSMIGRWATVLQSMDFDIRHWKHERHGNADGLTRLHRPEKVPKSEEVISWNEPEQEVGPQYGQVEIMSKHHVAISRKFGKFVIRGLIWIFGDWLRSSATWTSEHPAWIENLELRIIQAWRTNVEGYLLGFLVGSVRPGRRQLIAQELITRIVQLADDLPPDIFSQSDDSPAPYVLERSLDPYLQWTACLEEPRDEDTLPSRQEYLKPYDIIPHAFYPKAEEVVIDEDEEDDDEETSKEGSYSEFSEGEPSEEEEEKAETGSEWEALPEEAARTGTEAEDPEATQLPGSSGYESESPVGLTIGWSVARLIATTDCGIGANRVEFYVGGVTIAVVGVSTRRPGSSMRATDPGWMVTTNMVHYKPPLTRFLDLTSTEYADILKQRELKCSEEEEMLQEVIRNMSPPPNPPLCFETTNGTTFTPFDVRDLSPPGTRVMKDLHHKLLPPGQRLKTSCVQLQSHRPGVLLGVATDVNMLRSVNGESRWNPQAYSGVRKNWGPDPMESPDSVLDVSCD
ncbi:hypothetical protein CBR_g40778 [Chara braunii]|uniref:Reverse transcriptase domain-containing protein n=1 Tax=Chara braunii TaxID=69332 RepID=A0A388LUM2_CHABU|nr:hypothetical protein CBR_g40778 [Chara braunii]|eukprot:GBG85965.1 hypothetical protein CBR_g40778 [Chara braunii]